MRILQADTIISVLVCFPMKTLLSYLSYRVTVYLSECMSNVLKAQFMV